ncbi:hypothetical protein HDU96_006518 [Phlyctochytrium bullatum]|nr:hypothetical protein HDU96_006518 [Phlyctochytrium bullatum]
MQDPPHEMGSFRALPNAASHHHHPLYAAYNPAVTIAPSCDPALDIASKMQHHRPQQQQQQQHQDQQPTTTMAASAQTFAPLPNQAAQSMNALGFQAFGLKAEDGNGMGVGQPQPAQFDHSMQPLSVISSVPSTTPYLARHQQQPPAPTYHPIQIPTYTSAPAPLPTHASFSSHRPDAAPSSFLPSLPPAPANFASAPVALPSILRSHTTTPHSHSSYSPSSVKRTVNIASRSVRCEWIQPGRAVPCGMHYVDMDALYHHLCNDHVGRKTTNNLSLQCHWGGCGVVCATRPHAPSHVRTPLPLNPDWGPVCSRAFKRPQDLKKHDKLHTREPRGYAATSINLAALRSASFPSASGSMTTASSASTSPPTPETSPILFQYQHHPSASAHPHHHPNPHHHHPSHQPYQPQPHSYPQPQQHSGAAAAAGHLTAGSLRASPMEMANSIHFASLPITPATPNAPPLMSVLPGTAIGLNPAQQPAGQPAAPAPLGFDGGLQPHHPHHASAGGHQHTPPASAHTSPIPTALFHPQVPKPQPHPQQQQQQQYAPQQSAGQPSASPTTSHILLPQDSMPFWQQPQVAKHDQQQQQQQQQRYQSAGAAPQQVFSIPAAPQHHHQQQQQGAEGMQAERNDAAPRG